MTLRNQFRKINLSTWINDKDTEKLEIIAEEFAIDFSDWLNINAYKYPTKTTTKELLEIYKKEKNL